MPFAPAANAPQRRLPIRCLLGLLRACASVPLAMAVMVVLVAVLALATCLERWYGSAAARFGIYETWWFTALAVLLAINTLAALLVRFPWKRRLTGFLLTHVGLLVLLLGCLLTRYGGIDANLPVFEGQAAWRAFQESYHFELLDQADKKGQPAAGKGTVPFSASPSETTDENRDSPRAAGREPIRVAFTPGPFNWEDYQQLSWFPWCLAHRDQGVLYDRDGIRLEVLDYYSDSQPISLPWLQLRVGPGGSSSEGRSQPHATAMPIVLKVRTSKDPHAAGRPFGLGMRSDLPGGQRVVFWMTGSAEETAAFRGSQPDGPLGEKGRLVLRSGGHDYQFAVDRLKPNLRQPLGSSGLEIELLQFDPSFLSVQLLVHHGKEPPQRMLLLADLPEYNEQDDRDGVFGAFWYDATRKPSGDGPGEEILQEARRPRLDILQGADQKLYFRAWQAPKLMAAGAMPTAGQRLVAFKGTAAATELQVERFIASPRPDTMPMPAPFSKMKADGPQQRQARVRLTIDGAAEEFWLGATPSDPLESPPANVQKICGGQGRQVAVSLQPDAIDLGVQIYLRKFRRKLDPGTSQAAYYSSLVDFLDRDDPERRLRSEVLVTMNGPVDFADPRSGRSYRLFQTSFQGPLQPERLDLPWNGPVDPPPRLFLSYLTVNADPGRGLKYAGCLILVAGIFCRFFLRGTARAATTQGALPDSSSSAESPRNSALLDKPAVAPLRPALLLAAMLCTAGAARADDAATLDWSVWQRLPVLDGGRIMPLDTFARTYVKKICGSDRPRLGLRGSLALGEAAATVPATAGAVFEGQKSRSFTAAELLFAWLAEPELWEYVPFLPAADPQLRSELLEVPLRDEDGQPLRYVSPHQVFRAAPFRKRLDELGAEQPHVHAGGQRPQLSDADKQAETLFEAYTSYRLLTFHPRFPPAGRGRFLEKLFAIAQTWNGLESNLMRFFPADKPGGAAALTAETAETVRKLTTLAEQEEDLSLDDVEPLVVSLEHSTAGLAKQMTALADRMAQHPPALADAQVRRFRLILRGMASRTGELARLVVAARLALFDNGLALRLAPALDVAALEADRDTDDDAQPWASVSTLVDGSADLLGRYPQPQLQQFQQAYRQAAAAYRDHGNPQRPERFAAAMQALAASLRELGEAIEPIRNRLPIRERDDALMATTAYPSPGSTAAEVFYNRLDPFFWSWAISLGAVLLLAVSFAGMRKPAFWAGMLLLLAAQTLIVVGFALRMDITGWAPVTNMFETIVFVALSAALLGMWFTLSPLLRVHPVGALQQVYARKPVVLVGALVALVASILAYYAAAFPKDIRPLMPVLRSNVWLAFHVLTITASYGAGFLAWGLGSASLFCYLCARYDAPAAGRREPAACAALGSLTYIVVQIAVLLLTIGTILGAMWADVSWGRFWGWDPKEVWALITLLIYMVLLHGRHVGLSGNFSMALGAVFGFNAIVMAWFGVNFLLPGGKHSYGEGAGGQWYLLTVLLLDWLFVAAAVMRYLAENASTAERPAADGGDSS